MKRSVILPVSSVLLVSALFAQNVSLHFEESSSGNGIRRRVICEDRLRVPSKVEEYSQEISPQYCGDWIHDLYLMRDFITSSQNEVEIELPHHRLFASRKPSASAKLARCLLKKEGKETITLADHDIHVTRVTWQLPGPKSAFWRATLWYRDDGILVKSEVKKGPPWASVVTTTLVREAASE